MSLIVLLIVILSSMHFSCVFILILYVYILMYKLFIVLNKIKTINKSKRFSNVKLGWKVNLSWRVHPNGFNIISDYKNICNSLKN